MNNAAIEAAARAYAGADADQIIYNGYGVNLGPRWRSEVPGIRAAIAAYEAASNPQHARAISILRRIVNGYRPAHGSMEAWDEARALLREVDGGVIADTR